jgi:hypothetical protein
MDMRNRLSSGPYASIVLSVILLGGGVVSSTAEATLTGGDEAMHGAPVPPTPLTWNDDLNLPESSGWEKRFFDKPLTQYNLPKSKFELQNGPGFSLKSPGKLPGIEFGVEMHSLGALHSVVPLEGLPKGWNSDQERPLLLPPSNISPDYNGGFFRFTW